MAASTGSIESIYLLLSLGANPEPLVNQELFSEVSMTGIRDSPERSESHTLLSLLCDIVRDLHPSDSHTAECDILNGRYRILPEEIETCGSPLELSISVLNYDSIIALLSLGADSNSVNTTPSLHIAVSLREPILTCYLLSYGADPNLRSREEQGGSTALHEADTKSLTAFFDPPRNQVTSYTEHLAEGVEAVDTDSEEAVLEREKACIAVLLHFGADIDARDYKGETAYMQRIREGDVETAEFLLEMGAYVDDSKIED